MANRLVRFTKWRQRGGPIFLLPSLAYVPEEDVDLDVSAWGLTLVFGQWCFSWTVRTIKDRYGILGQIGDADVRAMSKYIAKHNRMPSPSDDIRAILTDPSTAWLAAIIHEGGIFNAYTMDLLAGVVRERIEKRNKSQQTVREGDGPTSSMEAGSDDWMDNLGIIEGDE